MSKIYRHFLRLHLISADDSSNHYTYLMLVESTNPNKIVVNPNFGNNKADLEAIKNSIAFRDTNFNSSPIILKSTGRIFDRGASDDTAKRYGLEFRNILTKEIFVGYIHKGWGIYEEVFDYDSKFSKVDTAWLEKQLTTIADSIRRVNNISNKLTFPKDYSVQLEKMIKFVNKVNYKFNENISGLDNAINFLVDRIKDGEAYDDVDLLEKLSDVYFGLGPFVAVDDQSQSIENNGTIYDGYGGSVQSGWIGEHRKHVNDSEKIEDGESLVIRGPATDGTDHRYVGRFPVYDLENKTYTYEFEYFRNFDKRHKFYFACGTFINEATGGTIPGDWCDTNMPCLAIELSKSSSNKVYYKLYRQSSAINGNTENVFNRQNIPFEKNENGEFVAKLKIVIEGGTKKNVTIWKGYGALIKPSSAGTHWVGNIIPLNVKIYHRYNDDDIEVANVCVYQPADVPLVCGVGNWDLLASNEYYGVRDFKIFKGDIVNGVTSLESYADGSVRDIKLPNITKITSFAFAESFITSVYMPNVRTINGRAFAYTELTELSLPSVLDKIYGEAFRGCFKLTRVTFNSKPTLMTDDVFYGSDNLKTINVPWAEGEVANAPWGATNATINYNHKGG